MALAAQDRGNRGHLMAVALAWLGVLLMAVFAYWPGLSGPFLLDDYGAVAKLGDYGGVRNWETFKAYVFGGHSGPTGRPISLFSFLVDARDWPAEPWPFKRTNLAIHLLNGVLLGILTSQLLAALQMESRRIRWIAVVAAAFWLLHPFLVSTTLYIVQRMAQLATTFVFVGLIGYVYGRSLVAINALRGYVIMSLSLGIATLLALLSKENGILLPLLAGVLELTIFSSHRAGMQALHRGWVGLFLAAPSLVVVAFLVQNAMASAFFEIVPPRDFSRFERLLTQPRVLLDYLQHWFIPKLYTTGIYQDHFLKSTGLLAPVSTLLATLLNAAAFVLAFVKRREWPLLSLAILFFYGAHLLESSVLNLELYFEHRNYLAASFLFLPLVTLMQRKFQPAVFIAASVAVMLMLAGFSRYSATVWQDTASLVRVSALKAPTSARAQGRYATDLFNAGYHDEALEVLDRAVENVSSNHPLLYLTRLNILCYSGKLTESELSSIEETLATSFYDARSIRLYTVTMELVSEERCPVVTPARLRSVFEHMLEHPYNAVPASLGYSHIKYFIGRTHILVGEPQAAVTAFRESLTSRPGASHAMLMAALLASAGYSEEALDISAVALSQLAADRQSTIGGDRVSASDIREFQATVRADLEARQGAGTPDPIE